MPPKKRKLNNAGILSNSYVPPLTAAQVERELQKLPPDSLYSLTQLWLSLPATQPVPSPQLRKQGYTKETLAKECMKSLEELRKIKAKTTLKRRLINLILVEFYPSGINTLHLAQIDVQLLVDKPNMNLWVSSTAKLVSKIDEVPDVEIADDIADEERNAMLTKLSDFPISLDSQLFLDNFIMNLSNLYLTHVYISRHPYYPLLLIRVQMYDYSLKRVTDQASRQLITDLTNSTLDKMERAKFEQDFQSILSHKYGKTLPSSNGTIKHGKTALQRQIQIQSRPQVRSHKPFYILLPISSPHIIHTPSLIDDVSTKLILQTLETTLSQSRLLRDEPRKPQGTAHRDKRLNSTSAIASLQHEKIMIFRDTDIKRPLRNLNTVFTLKGISRFADVSGAWSPYADDAVDMGVLEEELKHLVVRPEEFVDLTEDSEEDELENNSKEKVRERKIVAALKFKGTVGKKKSGRMFDTKYGSVALPENHGKRVESNREKSTRQAEDEDEDEDIGILDAEKLRLNDPYASAIAVSEAQFTVEGDLIAFFKNRNKSRKISRRSLMLKDTQFNFQMDLLGNDVYGGLHELAARGDVDPYNVPDWLTGENGNVGGSIKASER